MWAPPKTNVPIYADRTERFQKHNRHTPGTSKGAVEGAEKVDIGSPDLWAPQSLADLRALFGQNLSEEVILRTDVYFIDGPVFF